MVNYNQVTLTDPPALSRCVVKHGGKAYISMRDCYKRYFFVALDSGVTRIPYNALQGYRAITDEEWNRFSILPPQSQEVPQTPQ